MAKTKKQAGPKKVAAVKSRKAPARKVARPEVAAPAQTTEVKLPTYDKVQVVRILDSGHSKTHFHCYLADGTTRHVPKHLFN